MIGKVLLGGLALIGLYEGGKWWEKNKAQISMAHGASYLVTFDYTKAPIAPMSQAGLQGQLNISHPGIFNVVNVTMVPNAKQVAALIQVVGGDTYVTGSDLSSNWPAGFGTVSLETVKPAPAAPTVGMALA